MYNGLSQLIEQLISQYAHSQCNGLPIVADSLCYNDIVNSLNPFIPLWAILALIALFITAMYIVYVVIILGTRQASIHAHIHAVCNQQERGNDNDYQN